MVDQCCVREGPAVCVVFGLSCVAVIVVVVVVSITAAVAVGVVACVSCVYCMTRVVCGLRVSR